MAFEVRFLAEAEEDLFDIYVYVVENGGVERADAYDPRLRATCLKLADFPNRGTPRGTLEPNLRSIPFEGRATVYYRVVGNAVEVIRILYRGRDADREFQS